MTLNGHSNPITRVIVDDQNCLISISTDGMFLYWNLRAYVKIFSRRLNIEVRNFSINHRGDCMALSNLDEIRIANVPMNSPELDVVGPDMRDKYEYISYILKILRGEKFEYDSKWDDWAVLPYRFNTMYFYAYRNLYNEIKSSILNGGSLIPSIFTDPFTMLIHKNYQRCLKVLFDCTSSMLEKNLYSLTFLNEESIIRLNKQGHNQLHRFYNSIFNKYTSELFPKFAIESELPKYVLSKTLTPILENFFSVTNINEEGENYQKTHQKIT